MRLHTCLLALLLLAAGGLSAQADYLLQPYSYREGFENDMPPVVLWASRGSAPTITTLAPSTERAFEGAKSLKIDVTFGDSSYYYFGLPLRVPAAGKLTISARLWLAEGNQNNVGFGVNFTFPPTTHSGCSPIESLNKPTGEWKLVTADLVDSGRACADGVMSNYVRGVSGREVAAIVDRWALFLTGTPGKRVVAYLDDVRIEGAVPTEQSYLADVRARFETSRQAFLKQVEGWEQQHAAAQPAVVAAATRSEEAPALAAAIKTADEHARTLLGKFRQDRYASPAELTQLQRDLATLEHWPRALSALNEAKAAGRSFLVAPCNRPTTVARAAGNELTAVISADKTLACSACAGEYEPVSAIAYALQGVAGLTAACSPLKSGRATIPASAVDVRVVKSWFQGASNGIGYTPSKWLIPELLLKDDALVRVDLQKQTNELRHTSADGTEQYLVCSDPDSTSLEGVRPVEAATLQPLDLAAGQSREYWLTVHVPEQTPAGVYRGEVTFRAAAGASTLPLQVTVRPFALRPSRLIYSIYYRGTLSPDGQPTISSEGKSEEQYRAEIADLKAHGVLYPTNYQSRNEKLPRALQIRRECGMPTEQFYNLGYSVGQQSEAQLPALREEVRAWLDLLKPLGYRTVSFYGIDEATGDTLVRQRAAWQAVQESGAKTFVACYKKTFEAMGKLLNTAVLAGAPDPDEARKYHGIGSQAFCYANPQVGVEDPQVYRRNFGLVLWKAGFDGAMDYAYQHGFHHVWNDFDDKTYRDHNFTYPTVNGVVDTIAWEGFREAVDDVRYVTTLEQAIREAKPARAATAKQARAWLEALDPTGDPDTARAQLAEWIMKLR